ncbi:MAG: hypothetical protein R3E87_00425 [Burkholderiaceae bacterium]
MQDCERISFSANRPRFAGHTIRAVALRGLACAWLVAIGAAPMLPTPASAQNEAGGLVARTVPNTREAGIRGGIVPLLQHLNRPGARAIVLMSLPGCGFCTLVRSRQLGPLRADAAYDDLPVYEISLEDDSPLPPLPESWPAEFKGSATKVGPWARELGVRLAPTVLFLGAQGEIAPRLVGYASDDFYWSYLSERIDVARSAAAR